MFTTDFGIASLILKEIPYRAEAYIRLQATDQPEALLRECVGCCRACGAQRFYATCHPYLEKYPLHTAVVRMQCSADSLPVGDAALFPVLPETLEMWRGIYNERMAGVPNASYMTEKDGKTMLSAGDGYFVHRGGQLLGIGKASFGKIEAVISTVPGCGKDVVLALATLLTEETVSMEVASANQRAVKLYERLGFVPTEELSRWCCVNEIA